MLVSHLVTVTSRYGPQPARAVVSARGSSPERVAFAIGVKVNHLRFALEGRVRPGAAVRERLPAYLGLPLEELFTAESTAEPYGARSAPPAPGPRRRGARGPGPAQPPLTAAEHAALAVRLGEVQAVLTDTLIEVSRRYRVRSERRLRTAAVVAADVVSQLRSALDAQLLADVGEDAYDPGVYYPGATASATATAASATNG